MMSKCQQLVARLTQWFQSMPSVKGWRYRRLRRTIETTRGVEKVQALVSYLEFLGPFPEIQENVSKTRVDVDYLTAMALVRTTKSMVDAIENEVTSNRVSTRSLLTEDWFIDDKSYAVHPEDIRLGVLKYLKRFHATGVNDDAYHIDSIVKAHEAVFSTLLNVSDVFHSFRETDNGQTEKSGGDRK